MGVVEWALIVAALFTNYAPELIVMASEPSEATVGRVCADNSTCTGDNEFCLIQNRLDRPCRSGRCACRDGYTFTAGFCVRKIFINNLGDACGKTIGEVIAVKNAGCYSFIVKCRPGFVATGNTCLLRPSCTSWDSRCPSDMICDLSHQLCRCSKEYEIFDPDTQHCVRREFGDPCADDEHCQTEGSEWSGFTYGTAVCEQGQCACREKEVEAAYLDPVTNEVKRKTICVNYYAITNVTQSSSCTLDPVFWSDREYTSICDVNHVCVQCPEDLTGQGLKNAYSGYCRRVLQSGERLPSLPTTTTTEVPGSNYGRDGFRWNFWTEDVDAISSTTEITPTRAQNVFFPCFVPQIPNGKLFSLRGTEVTGTIIPGTQVLLVCSSGYVVKYGANKVQCLITGGFSEKIGQCMPRLTPFEYCSIPVVANGAISADADSFAGRESIVPGSVVSLVCSSGYVVQGGAGEATCQDNGYWSVQLGRCSPA